MKKILATILAVAMLATTFVGCGNGGETASTPSDDGGAAAPEITACIGPEPETLDPALNKSVDGACYAVHAFEGIYKFDENGMLSDETPLSFTYLVNTPGGNVDVAVAIQADMAAVGIDMQISEMEWNVFLNDRKAGNYDVARNGWLMDYNDPLNMLEMWTSDSGNNDCQFGKPKA